MVEKNQKKQKAKKQRVFVKFNTGTRTFASGKNYKRIKRWSEDL